MSRSMKAYAGNAPWLKERCGKKFNLRPLQFVLSLHSSHYWHGLSDGKLAALWDWMCLKAKSNQPIYNSLTGKSIVNASEGGIVLPLDRSDMEKKIAMVLCDHFIDCTLDQAVLITRPWRSRFFPETSEWLTTFQDNKPLLRVSPNKSHPDAREVYWIEARVESWLSERRWYLRLEFGYDGSRWQLELFRGVPDDRKYSTAVAFDPELNDAEFDAAVAVWLKENVEFTPTLELKRKETRQC